MLEADGEDLSFVTVEAVDVNGRPDLHADQEVQFEVSGPGVIAAVGNGDGKAASPQATVGSAYEMAPAYPKTDSDDDRAATARYHAMNNVFFLEAAMHGRYPKAFVGEPPYELMGFKAGDEKLLYAPLDWVGFHYYTRRIVSDASGAISGRRQRQWH
jgi:beta-glucosidase/6-phospho-beta-glucosidase/beta-galactosidase